jgi:hypothetical protein
MLNGAVAIATAFGSEDRGLESRQSMRFVVLTCDFICIAIVLVSMRKIIDRQQIFTVKIYFIEFTY